MSPSAGKNRYNAAMRYLPALIIMLMLAPSLKASELDNWYQIEVIVFSQRNPEVSNERQEEIEQVYPDNLLSILPADSASLTPLNLEQATLLAEYEALLPDEEEEQEDSTPVETFLFADRLKDTSRNTSCRFDDTLLNTTII